MLTVDWTCRNVVVTFELGRSIDLRAFTERSANCEYNPKRFSAAILRLRAPRVTVLVFGSGRCVLSGAKSLDDARMGAKRTAQIVLRRTKAPPCTVQKFVVQNTVHTCQLPCRIRIDPFYERLRREKVFVRCFYDPISFPGIRCKVDAAQSTSVLIFATGKIICAGATNAEQVLDAGNRFIFLLDEYMRRHS